MHRLLPLLFLACASTSPTEYERGTYRPAPPAFNPTQDAPHTTGQPGHLRTPQEYPRSPHTRVLPPSREPGLWAGDSPRASNDVAVKPSLLGVTLPGIPLSRTQVDNGPALVCAQTWGLAIPRSGLSDKVNALDAPTRQCMVAQMLQFCARVVAELDDISREDGVVVLRARQVREKFQKSADDFARRVCAGVRLTDEQRQLMESLAAAFIDTLS